MLVGPDSRRLARCRVCRGVPVVQPMVGATEYAGMCLNMLGHWSDDVWAPGDTTQVFEIVAPDPELR